MSLYTITKTEDVCLVVLSGAPARLDFVSATFNLLGGRSINIDMISQSPPTGDTADLSFTVSDDDLAAALAAIAELRGKYPQIKSNVSSGNIKLLVSGEQMKKSSGIAAKVFGALQEITPSVTLVTTSEIDISILIQGAEAETAYDTLLKSLN